MNTRTRIRTGAGAAALALVAAALLAPTAAQAAPLRTENGGGACEVTGGTFKWGVKESFRAYISGAIANGAWEPSGGAVYETPDFTWSDATGELDPETGEGSVSFTGVVHFTGHGGVLDLTLANPTIEFDSEGKAVLLLDTKSTNAQGELAIDATQEWVADIALAAPVKVSDGAVKLEKAETTLTNSGAKAFAGFYQAGVKLDPVTLDLSLADCDSSSAGDAGDAGPADADGEAGSATVETSPAEGGQVPWLPVSIGGVALLAIGFTVGVLVGARQRQAPQGGERETPEE